MLILSILFLCSSNAVSLRRDKSILYARVIITVLILCSVIGLDSYSSEIHANYLAYCVNLRFGFFIYLYAVSLSTVIRIFTQRYIDLVKIITRKCNIEFNNLICQIRIFISSKDGINAVKQICLVIYLGWLVFTQLYSSDFILQYWLEINPDPNESTELTQSGLPESDIHSSKPLPPVYDSSSEGWVANPDNPAIRLEVTSADSSSIKTYSVDGVDLGKSKERDGLDIACYREDEGLYFEGSSAKVSTGKFEMNATKDTLEIREDNRVIHELRGNVALEVDKDSILASSEYESVEIQLDKNK